MTSFYSPALRKWQRVKGFRDPYLAIAVAAEEGRGCVLSASDCRYLCGDNAITTVASNHYDEIMGEDVTA